MNRLQSTDPNAAAPSHAATTPRPLDMLEGIERAMADNLDRLRPARDGDSREAGDIEYASWLQLLRAPHG